MLITSEAHHTTVDFCDHIQVSHMLNIIWNRLEISKYFGSLVWIFLVENQSSYLKKILFLLILHIPHVIQIKIIFTFTSLLITALYKHLLIKLQKTPKPHKWEIYSHHVTHHWNESLSGVEMSTTAVLKHTPMLHNCWDEFHFQQKLLGNTG